MEVKLIYGTDTGNTEAVIDNYLLNQLEDVVGEVADEQEAKVDELTNEVEELKQKVNK